MSYAFWRRFAELPNVVAIKIAPFNRYQTIDVVRAVVDAGRDDVVLYTGNDDHIVGDLRDALPLRHAARSCRAADRRRTARALGGVDEASRRSCWSDASRRPGFKACQRICSRAGIEVTDSNAAFFDAANGFAGCIAGLHEVLRRQGLLETVRCLDPHEGLSPVSAKRSIVCTSNTRI